MPELKIVNYKREPFQASYMGNGEFSLREMEGYPLERDDLPGIRFYVDKRGQWSSRWVVTEGWSGQQVGEWGETRQHAIENANAAIDRLGPENVPAAICEAIITQGRPVPDALADMCGGKNGYSI